VFGGGVNGVASTEAYKLDLSQVNWFDQKEVEQKKWVKIEKLPEGRYNHTCFVHDEKIYLVGGTKKSE